MANVDQRLLHMLYDCYRIIIVQAIDYAKVVRRSLLVLIISCLLLRNGCIANLVHLEVVALEDVLRLEPAIEECYIFVF